MSNLSGYPTRSFKESQKFLVQEPSTGTASLVLGSDLVDYITPRLNSVIAETTRVAAENTDYGVGEVIQTTGATSPGDDFASLYLVVEGGAGDFPMINGNDLLILRGDEFLREQLVQPVATFDNVAEMVADLTLPEGRKARTLGYYAVGDGGGNDYEIVAGGTGAADGGSFINLDNGLQAKGLFVSPVSVKKFGAVGDGVTDSTVAVQAAMSLYDVVEIPEDNIFLVDTLTKTGTIKFIGGGTLKWSDPTLLRMFELTDAIDCGFFGVTVDANNVISETTIDALIKFYGLGTENFTIQDCVFTGCIEIKLMDHNDNSVANTKLRLTGNRFEAGTDKRFASHFFANLNNMYGYLCSNNIFQNLAMIATTIGGAHTVPSSDENPGDFIVSNNICRGFFPNSLSDPAQQSMILIRSTTSAGTVRKSKLVVSNNVIEGGKKGISFGENPDQIFDSVVISGNVCKNNINGGISVGRNDDNITHNAIVVSNNVCYWDIAYLDSVSPGVTDQPRRLLSLEGPNILCANNVVENGPQGGVFVEGDNCVVSGNRIVNCPFSEAAMTANLDFGAGIFVLGGLNTMISDNCIIGGGYSATDTRQAHGIGITDTSGNDGITITGNVIQNLNDFLVTAICLCRFSNGTEPKDLFVSDNNLIGFENSGTIVPRDTLASANYHKIVNNNNWGEVETTWNPGTVTAGSTASVTLNMKDCIIGDIVHFEFAGIREDFPSDISQWSQSAAVTVSSYWWVSIIGEIDFFITNNTGSDQTFSQAWPLKVWIERRNKS